MKQTFEGWSFGGHRLIESWLEEMACSPQVEVDLNFFTFDANGGTENPTWACGVRLYLTKGTIGICEVAYGEGKRPYDAVLECAKNYWDNGNKEAA